MTTESTGGKLLPALAVLLLLLLAGAAASVFFSAPGDDGDQALNASLLLRESLAATAARKAQNAVRGETAVVAELEALSGEIKRASLPPNQQNTAQVDQAWTRLQADLAALLGNTEPIGVVQRAAATVEARLPTILTEVGNLAALPGQSGLIDDIQQFELGAQRLRQAIDELASGSGDPVENASRLAAADEYLGQFIRALSEGDPSMGIAAVQGADAQSQVAEIRSIYEQISAAARDSVVAAEGFAQAAGAAGSLAQNSDAVAAASGRIRNALSAGRTGSPVSWLPLLLIGAGALTFLAMAFMSRKAAGAQRAAQFEAEQNTRNQDAILRLLDELGSLADGDLTVQATVSEDITGAIADSINYAIEALRDLVTTIDEAASQVDEAARQTQASASHLAQASENQSRQVKAATQSIADMAESIEEVSHNAERSSEVARHSVEIAHKGGDAVRRTIDGMNTIRETIQETSKRIKRLGESSQEIGNIVELINDIAEQTNILALNASIQASMAGEAGRGFAVVADEVQRLAERSANATKQIEVLVNTIQSDTNEAVVSMERSTTDVVSGALLAENAGSALDEIEKVSNQIASLVQNISGSARTQATAAADMTRNMGVLQEISSQTADGSNATSTAIGKLAEMATDLRRSVAGFTLPDKEPAPLPGMPVSPGKVEESAKATAES